MSDESYLVDMDDKFAGYSEIKFVREHDLHVHAGWVLLAVREERRVQTEYDNEKCQNTSIGTNQDIVLVMGRPVESVEMDLRSVLQSEKDRVQEVGRESLQRREENEKLLKKVEQLETDLKVSRDSTECEVTRAVKGRDTQIEVNTATINDLREKVIFAAGVTDRLEQWVGEKTWNEVTWLVEEDRETMRKNARAAQIESAPNL